MNVEGFAYQESADVMPGEEIVVADAGPLRIGMSICYDLRFPEEFRIQALRGANVVTLPSAFTAPTGKDHWEPLLRARAIENQVFVIAPDQRGASTPKLQWHGRSMIVDPWGVVLAQAPDTECFITADLDLDAQTGRARRGSRASRTAARRPTTGRRSDDRRSRSRARSLRDPMSSSTRALAEELGYERVWLFDSPALYPDVWVTLAQVAEATERVGHRARGAGPRVAASADPGERDRDARSAGAGSRRGGDRYRLHGRMALGQPAMPWADTRTYIAQVRGLLEGEAMVIDGAVVKMIPPDGFLPRATDRGADHRRRERPEGVRGRRRARRRRHERCSGATRSSRGARC